MALSPLLYADSEHNSDMRYFGRVLVGDAFIAFEAGRKKIALFSALEIDRAKKESTFDEILSLEKCVADARASYPRRKVGPAEIIALLADRYKIRKFAVSDDFPTAIFVTLRGMGIKLETSGPVLFPSRETKSTAEAGKIREGNRCSALGIAAGEAALRKSKIKAGKLFYEGKPLTSEKLKLIIDIACLEAGGTSLNTIAAGGDQGCDPHGRGTGPLRANELIILDVFPRINAHGYFGDMTRTFLKGRASDAQRKLVAAVRSAQLLALKHIRTGITGKAVHEQVAAFFKSSGYETVRDDNGWRGFFHGTGHGLGLAIHEPPRMSAASEAILKKGTVVTVEPGLYYRGIGGCRIEDVVQVTDSKPRMLSSHPYEWELR